MEREAVKGLFMQHYDKMQRVARTLLFDVQESEDVCSDIFESLLCRQTMLVPGTEERYLMTSVLNRCLKRLRHEAVVRDYGQQTTDNSQETDDERLADIVEFVVSHLSEREQRIFNLRFTEGCSYEDIAAAEGISKVAVWKHLSHIITEIKKRFNPGSL
ncbi:MAG: sigma-70 family RNA polymerase sigma factor [Bacteroidaceae bacterium]|nr:sigma-70 family RNA polymerase sigma factor [Bacteroidaceae bacterium]